MAADARESVPPENQTFHREKEESSHRTGVKTMCKHPEEARRGETVQNNDHDAWKRGLKTATIGKMKKENGGRKQPERKQQGSAKRSRNTYKRQTVRLSLLLICTVVLARWIVVENTDGNKLEAQSFMAGLRTGCKQWGYPAIHKTERRNTLLTLFIILLAGDVETNPGPVKYPCGICGKPVANNHRALECDSCNQWHHIKCAGITPSEYNQFVLADEQGRATHWECFTCSLPSLSDSFFVNEPHGMTRGRAESSSSEESITEVNGSDRDGRQLKIILINCRGVKSMKKRADLHGLLHTENPDIVLATESHLDKNINDAEIFPPDSGYKILRKDRTKHGGGVFIAYKENLVVTNMTELGKNNECIYVKLQLQHAQTLHLGCFYRPTDCRPDALNALHQDLHKLLDKERTPNLILGGDFNVPNCDWNNLCFSQIPNYGVTVNNLVLDLTRELGLTQMVETLTRERNLLDLLFCTNPDGSNKPEIIPGISDHRAVSMTVHVRPLPSNTSQEQCTCLRRKIRSKWKKTCYP